MDFLDSLTLDLECKSSHKRTRRMQSWYMYEQYKSLERNQMDAAQKLKHKSNQDRILHQEMAERRTRRRLCEEPGCQSESRIDSVKSEVKSCVSLSNDDFFESFCEMHNEEEIAPTVMHEDSSRNDSQTGQQLSEKWTVDEYKSTEEINEDKTQVESENNEKTFISNANLIYNALSRDNLADDIKEELEFVKKNIAENISLQLETVKESIQCLEEFTKFRDSDQLSKYDYDSESVGSTEDSVHCACATKMHETENNVFAMWSKLVSFAYQIMQLNHGNCYYDYSSQFLTAVLACDVLRMGVNKICNILQPYVTPIKFVTNECETEIVKQKCHKHVKRKKFVAKKFKKNFQNKFLPHRTKTPPLCSCARPYLSATPSVFPCCDNKQSDDSWGQSLFENKINEKKCRIYSEPMGSVAKLSNKMSSGKTSSTIWPEEYYIKFSDENLSSSHTRVANPMLKLANHIDEIFKEIEYSKHM